MNVGSQVVIIKNAKVPVLKFVSVFGGLNVDVTINNGMPLCPMQCAVLNGSRRLW